MKQGPTVGKLKISTLWLGGGGGSKSSNADKFGKLIICEPASRFSFIIIFCYVPEIYDNFPQHIPLPHFTNVLGLCHDI